MLRSIVRFIAGSSKLKIPKAEEEIDMKKGGEMQVQKIKVAASYPLLLSLLEVSPHWVEAAFLGSWLLVRFMIW